MFFIAEVSSNHSRDLKRCLDLVEASKRSGFDAIKFQAFKVEELFSEEILISSPEHLERKGWEFPIEFLPEIKKRCEQLNIKLGITPFYLDAVKECLPYVDFFKIASYELLWNDLLKEVCKTNKKMIISTGMANIEEVISAVSYIEKHGCKDLSILHCVSSYPVSDKEVNLGAINHLRKEFNWPIGWSDHSRNTNVIVSAVLKWGAEIVEMHLDLEGNGAEYGPGHCWLPEDSKNAISICKSSELYNGSGVKKPTQSEEKERVWRADPSDGLRPHKIIR